MTSELNDTPAPQGFVYLGDFTTGTAHLAAADEDSPLPLCGARQGNFEEFAYLPAALKVCTTCREIVDRGSSLSGID